MLKLGELFKLLSFSGIAAGTTSLLSYALLFEKETFDSALSLTNKHISSLFSSFGGRSNAYKYFWTASMQNARRQHLKGIKKIWNKEEYAEIWPSLQNKQFEGKYLIPWYGYNSDDVDREWFDKWHAYRNVKKAKRLYLADDYFGGPGPIKEWCYTYAQMPASLGYTREIRDFCTSERPSDWTDTSVEKIRNYSSKRK